MDDRDQDPNTTGPDAEADAGAGKDRARVEDVETLIAERDKYLEMARRARADFDNFQKRAARDLQTERQYAAQPFLADLLPVLDNLDRAIDSAKESEAGSGILAGVEMVRKQLRDALEKNGVRMIRPDGEHFDPNVHEAVMQQPSADHPPMTVLQTLQAGYMLRERVIRPAQVIVSQAPPSDP